MVRTRTCRGNTVVKSNRRPISRFGSLGVVVALVCSVIPTLALTVVANSPDAYATAQPACSVTALAATTGKCRVIVVDSANTIAWSIRNYGNGQLDPGSEIQIYNSARVLVVDMKRTPSGKIGALAAGVYTCKLPGSSHPKRGDFLSCVTKASPMSCPAGMENGSATFTPGLTFAAQPESISGSATLTGCSGDGANYTGGTVSLSASGTLGCLPAPAGTVDATGTFSITWSPAGTTSSGTVALISTGSVGSELASGNIDSGQFAPASVAVTFSFFSLFGNCTTVPVTGAALTNSTPFVVTPN
jgi:hypothetical protein